MKHYLMHMLALGTFTSVVACGGRDPEVATPSVSAAPLVGERLTVRDTTIIGVLEAAGVAQPIEQATLSTRLMGTVTHVLANAGDRVSAGQVLVRIDASDLEAKRQQVMSVIAGAEAVHREAELQATRMRKLYADSAAPRAQLDAVEAGLARSVAGLAGARAGEAELVAMANYATVRAPFAGVVTQRMVDPGAFATPGAPLITVQDQRTLRLTVNVAPASATALRCGATVDAEIEGVRVRASIEGVVPAVGGGLMTVNALVANRGGSLVSGGAAIVRVPQGTHRALLVPTAAIRREGDLVGVVVVRGAAASTQWVRLGESHGPFSEVTSGLRSGDVILVPRAAPRA